MMKKLFDRFRKKKCPGEPAKTPRCDNKKSSSKSAQNSKKQKDLIEWK